MVRQAPTNPKAEQYLWREPTYSKSEVWTVWLLWILPILATVITVVMMAMRFVGSGDAAGLDLLHSLGR
jgi:hypothetical protein